MCGRYTIRANVSDLQSLLPGLTAPEPLEARYNVAPTQPVPVVTNAAGPSKASTTMVQGTGGR